MSGSMAADMTRNETVGGVVTVTLNAAIDRVIEVPGFAVGIHGQGQELARIPAGKGVNVSRALALLGVDSVATGLVGRDELPAFEDCLAALGVQPQLLAVEGRTRENVTLVDPLGHTETHVRDVGPPVTAEQVDRLARKLGLLAGADRLVVFAGSLPAGMPVAALAEMIGVCTAASARLALDLPGEVLAELGDVRCWAAKPNVEELGGWLGRAIRSDDQLVEAGRTLSRSVRTVMVSRGAAGGYLFVDGSALIGQTEVDPDRVVSAVGCGDALLAGFIAAQTRGADVRDSYRFALAVASAAAVNPLPGHLETETVDEFLAVTSVEPVTA